MFSRSEHRLGGRLARGIERSGLWERRAVKTAAAYNLALAYQIFSEDWPYYANEGIKKEVGEDIWVAYCQGAEGDYEVDGCSYSPEAERACIESSLS